MSAAGVILRDSEGRILLQHRDDKKEISSPNSWCIFGGRIEKGETPIDCAVREIKEELCIDLSKEKLKLLKKIFIGGFSYHIYEYSKTVTLRDLNQKEGQGMGFFTREEIIAKKDVVTLFKLFMKFYKVL